MENVQLIKLLTKGIIKDHFPELTSFRLSVNIVKGKKVAYYMKQIRILKTIVLWVNKEVMKFSLEAITGLLAHELSHVALDMHKKIRDRYTATDKPTVIVDERNADLLVVERGLGRQLLQFHIEHEKKYKKYSQKDGLTRTEIRRLLEKK